jgi:uncharacterized protein YdeI (BOF family)
MALSDNNIKIYVYKFDGSYLEITDLISTMKYSCGLDKVSQQLDITMPYGIYSIALPSIFIDTGQKIEVYINNSCYYRGKIETSSISIDKEQITLTCYDYIRNLTLSKVVYNFSDISAYDAICQIFNDLEIPYSKDGILDGENGDHSSVMINHLIKNKSAYDACMMIATEVHRNKGNYYYMFMDVAGNVNLMSCDKYWSKQTIQATSSSNLSNPDGSLITGTYKKDASSLVTKVQVYDSKGNPVDIEAGVANPDDNEGGGE